MRSTARVDAGSFRDPASRVFHMEAGVFRALSERGLADWEKLKASGLYDELAAAGTLVATEDVAEPPDCLPGRWAGVVRHETIPFVSYPYEWSFGMLRQAALLQLDLLEAALARDLILKDASPYNVQFRGARPTFIDVGSFEPVRPGEPWMGYRQFCMLFLYPLMLRAYTDVPFQPWLRGRLEGISPSDMRNLMASARFRKGVMTHVLLHARLERRYADRSGDALEDVKRAGFRKELIVANVRRLRKTVRRMRWTPRPGAVWVEYGERNTYADDEAEQKARFVEAAVAAVGPERVWDLGCNDGRFAKIAARHARQVIALDGDESVVELLYRQLHDEGRTDILPLVVDLTDPSPDRGWMGRERRRLEARGLPDLVLALALVHHVVITENVPIAGFVGWLRGLHSALIIELPLADDPMVRRLLANKRGGLHQDYTREHFESCLREHFELEWSENLSGGTRVLYYARPRG